jgi:hypothetical protein
MAADAAPAAATGMVMISAARLAELVKTESRFKAKAHANIESLREKYTPPADVHAKRMLEKYHKNKEEINARRRDRYRLKKEAAKATATASPNPPGCFPVDP